MELTTVDGSGVDAASTITGKNVSLGMYRVRFVVKE